MAKSFQLPEEYYPFEINNNGETTYKFFTTNDVEYKIVFKSTPNIIGDNQPYSHLLYEFSMLAQFAGPHSCVRDDLIGATVIAIFLDFYKQYDQNICFYMSDFRDEKQHVRSRKFHDWYLKYNRGAFIKIDIYFKGYKEMIIPASIITAKDNPYRTEILSPLINLLTEYDNEK